MNLDPADFGPAEHREKVAMALARFRCEGAVDLHEFDAGFRLLDAEFGPANEMEGRAVLERWFRRRSLSPADAPIRAFYYLMLVRDGAEIAAVRDGFSAVDLRTPRVVGLMSHALVLPPWRRTGAGALLRAAPVAYARHDAAAAGVPGAEILVVAEMEMVEPRRPDTVIRLVAYGQAGFKVVPPDALPYAQPDFRDLDVLGVEPRPLPFLLLVRQIGQEQRGTLSADRAVALVDHLGAIHAPSVGGDQLDAIRGHALRNLGDGPVPLLDLPASTRDAPRIRPLLRSGLLPSFPEAWRAHL